MLREMHESRTHHDWVAHLTREVVSFFHSSLSMPPFYFQRVRHSETATNREYTVIEDMTCTMRVWHKTSGQPPSECVSRSSDVMALRRPQPGPELVLTPVCNALAELPHVCCSADFGSDNPIPLSDRFLSFGSVDHSLSNPSGRAGLPRSPRSPNASWHKVVVAAAADASGNDTTTTRRRIGTVTVPVKDIMMMDTNGAGGNNDHASSAVNRININTMSSGFFEITMDSTNGREVVLAFLKASIPKERVMSGGNNLRRSHSHSTHTTVSTKSFDVEAFTASRISERLKSESISEKMQRRVYRLVTSLDESTFLGGPVCARVHVAVRSRHYLARWKTVLKFAFLRSVHLSAIVSIVSSAFTECACGCSKGIGNSQVSKNNVLHLERRDSPPRLHIGGGAGSARQYNYDVVEMADEPVTPVRASPPRITLLSSGKYSMLDDEDGDAAFLRGARGDQKKADLLRESHMPSGLSVESDPEFEKNSAT
jgi:hypothetical protein